MFVKAMFRAGVALLGALAFASAATADSIQVTRFSPHVTGNTGGSNNTVTVSLLRNVTDPSTGLPVRNVVDSFTTTADGTGHWSGSFPHHALATAQDQIEVAASGGTGAPPLVTIGGGDFPASASAPPAHVLSFDPSSLIDNNVSLASDGTSVDASGVSCPGGTCTTYALVKNGTAGAPQPGATFSPSPALTNADDIALTVTFDGGGGPTTVSFTDHLPLLPVVAADETAPSQVSTFQPSCSLYAVTGEVVCGHLVPGTYTLTQLRGTTSVSSQTLTLPARTAIRRYQAMLVGSNPFAAISPGDQFVLKLGSRTLTTLTVQNLVLHSSATGFDPQNGSQQVLSGSCSPGIWLNDGHTVCPPNGAVPSTASLDLGYLSSIESYGAVIGGDGLAAASDDTSAGQTELDPPDLAYTSPDFNESVHLPFNALAIVRYNDPRDIVAAQNNAPVVGTPPTLPSRSSALPVIFATGPAFSGQFAPLGNANVPGGLPLPPLSAGAYSGRFTFTDAHGDSQNSYDRFVVQPSAPGGPPPASCSASAGSHLRASVAAARHKSKPKHRKKKKAKTSLVTVTLRCTAPVRSRVYVSLGRGTNLIGSGAANSNGRVKIPIQGKFVRGVYSLVSVVDLAGHTTERTQTLTLR